LCSSGFTPLLCSFMPPLLQLYAAAPAALCRRSCSFMPPLLQLYAAALRLYAAALRLYAAALQLYAAALQLYAAVLGCQPGRCLLVSSAEVRCHSERSEDRFLSARFLRGESAFGSF
jgi:hypothetical protein